jgi:hypothetical protein
VRQQSLLLVLLPWRPHQQRQKMPAHVQPSQRDYLRMETGQQCGLHQDTVCWLWDYRQILLEWTRLPSYFVYLNCPSYFTSLILIELAYHLTNFYLCRFCDIKLNWFLKCVNNLSLEPLWMISSKDVRYLPSHHILHL